MWSVHSCSDTTIADKFVQNVEVRSDERLQVYEVYELFLTPI